MKIKTCHTFEVRWEAIEVMKRDLEIVEQTVHVGIYYQQELNIRLQY